MLIKILQFFKGLSMENSKGIATLVVMGVIICTCLVVGIVSQRFLGPDNEIEKFAEDEMDGVIEEALHEPEGSVHINLNLPPKKED